MLRMMPRVLLVANLLCLAVAGLARFFFTHGSSAEIARKVQLFDYVMMGVVVVVWTAVVTISIGCVIVWLMKGPAYVADGYEVSHSDHPKV